MPLWCADSLDTLLKVRNCFRFMQHHFERMLCKNFWCKLKPTFRSITEVITQIQNVLQEISPCLYATNYQLTACCQLMQSVLKMDCALSERWVKTRWTDFKHEMTYKWWLSWLAVKSPWIAGHFSVRLFFLCANGYGKLSSHLVRTQFQAPQAVFSQDEP